MIAMTTNSSSNVKPRSPLPVTIRHSVEPTIRGPRVDVKDVIPGLRIVRRTLIRARAPGIRGRGCRVRPKRITRHTPKKIDLHALLRAAGVVDAIHEGLQVWRVTALIRLLLDTSGVGRLLV